MYNDIIILWLNKGTKMIKRRTAMRHTQSLLQTNSINC